MSDASDYILGIRNGAGINVMALASVKAEALGQIEIIAAWPPSSLRDGLLKRLEREVNAFDDASRYVADLRTEAEQAAAALLGGPVPEPPPPPEIGTGNTNWSTRDW